VIRNWFDLSKEMVSVVLNYRTLLLGGRSLQIISDFIFGVLHVIKVTGAPLLYRYPYRTSAEAMRTDWLNIGKDIDSVIGRLEDSSNHESRTEE